MPECECGHAANEHYTERYDLRGRPIRAFCTVEGCDCSEYAETFLYD